MELITQNQMEKSMEAEMEAFCLGDWGFLGLHVMSFRLLMWDAGDCWRTDPFSNADPRGKPYMSNQDIFSHDPNYEPGNVYNARAKLDPTPACEHDDALAIMCTMLGEFFERECA